MSVTLDSFFAFLSIGTEVEKRKVELCADCGYFRKYRCELGYRTRAWRKPCRSAVHRLDMQDARKRWSW